MTKTLGSILMLSTMTVACGPLEGMFLRPVEAKCDSAPTNTTKDSAEEVPLGQAILVTHCPTTNGASLWWKTPKGSYAQGDKFHVAAEFRDGAGNVDLQAGVLNTAGNDVVASNTDGNCSNPNGAAEDCTITLGEATDVVYLHTGASDPGKETFKLTVTRL